MSKVQGGVDLIAEIGINHQGDFGLAKQMVCLLGSIGVRKVKFQYRNLDRVYSHGATREIGDEILSSEIRKNYLSVDQILLCIELARELDIQTGISFFKEDDVHDFGGRISDFDFFKIPSVEFLNEPLINKLFDTGKHLYLSSGAHSEEEIEYGIGCLEKQPRDRWTLMHCVSNYPLLPHNANLNYIAHLRSKYSLEVGYSSHDEMWEYCLAAIALGASVIERHFTVDRRLDGLDHSTSSDLGEFQRLALICRDARSSLGGFGDRVMNTGELINRQNLGRSLHYQRSKKAGDHLNLTDFEYMQPATGINYYEFQRRNLATVPLIQDVSPHQVCLLSHFQQDQPLEDEILDFLINNKIGFPVRLHDLSKVRAEVPTKVFEFHLSHGECSGPMDIRSLVRKDERYSIHLPDYVSSTKLLNFFSADLNVRDASHAILKSITDGAEAISNYTGFRVPLVISLSALNEKREGFYENLADFILKYERSHTQFTFQTLPPYAWYFGGSVKVDLFNTIEDFQLCVKYKIPLTVDYSHLMMSANFSNFSLSDALDLVKPIDAHNHLSTASGVDDEGGGFDNSHGPHGIVVRSALQKDVLKIVEVWQGHLNNFAGFKRAARQLAEFGAN